MPYRPESPYYRRRTMHGTPLATTLFAPMPKLIHPLRAASLPLLLASLCGCATSPELNELIQLHRTGVEGAALELLADEDVRAEMKSKRDGLLWRLEAGKVLQDAGRHEESERQFRAADKRMREFDLEPSIRIGGEVGGLLTNPAARAYRGTEYDRILLECYRVWNQLVKGDLSEALVHCRRAFVRQSEAVERNADRIAEERRAANSKGVEIADLVQGTKFEAAVAASRTRIDPTYADWVNPYATWLVGVLQWIDGDYTNCEVDLRKLKGMLPSNSGVSELLAEVESGAVARAPGMTRVFVIHEAGDAPTRISENVVIETLRFGLTPIVFPVLAYEGRQPGGLDITDEKGAVLARTETVADFEAIVANDYDARLAGVVLRAFLSVIVKEAATEALVKADEDDDDEDDGWGFLVGNLYKVLSAGCDTRTWRSPSARIEVCQFLLPTGEIAQLHLLNSFGTRIASYQTKPQTAPILFVRVRSHGAGAVSIQTATLEGPASPTQP